MGNLSKQSGIYAIVNIMDSKVYVGQAKEFNNRDHFLQLKKGNDTKRLQADYDREKELVYFVLGNLNQETEWNDTDLDSFEKMYMTIFEDLQFELYNCNIQRKDREIESLEDFVKEQYHSAIESLNNDFFMRFGKKAKDVPKLTEGEKKEMLEKYADKRLKHPVETSDEYADKRSKYQVETSDRFFFNRNRIKKIIDNTMHLEDLESLNLDEFFFHKVGNYLNEGIDQIIDDRKQKIKDNEYCLWAFAANAVNAETMRSLCRERAKHHTDTYVLFSITPSSKYASSKSHKQSVLKGKDCKDLATDEIAFLNLQEVGKKDYKVPDAVACTAKSSTSANAFVIQEISLIDGDIEKSNLAENYLAVNKSGNLYQHTKRKVCSTFYMRSNKKLHDNKALFETPDNKSFCFLGKLAAPYVIKLTGQEKEFINILRSYGITEYWCSKGFDPGADKPCGELLLPTGHSGCAARVYDLFNETDTMLVDVRTAVEGSEAFHKLAGELEHRRL